MVLASSVRFSTLSLLAPVFAVLLGACASAADPVEDSASTSGEALSTTIHSTYGVTTFGGPGDYQTLACGGNSRTSQEWYVASSQRYGCHVHLRLEANGKCVVVQTEDAGPASYVESRAGIAVLDSSPAVGTYLFGTSGLGYSDLAHHPGKYTVKATVTSAALGPCSASSNPPVKPPVADAGSSTDPGSGTGTTTDAGSSTGDDGDDAGSDPGTNPVMNPGSTSSGTPCSNDGQCNPGGDGAGQICVSNVCVDGCNADWQCPGNTSCNSGMCQ